MDLIDRQGVWYSVSYTQENSKATVSVNFASYEIPVTPGNASFHLFLDASVAELIVNQRHAVTTRIYRQPDGPLRINVSTLTKFTAFEAWQLRPISPDRLTT
jgi:hypothetical protein